MVPATRERLVRWSGCAALGLVTFAAGVQLAFPYPRLQERLVAALAAYDVSVDRLTRGWRPGRFALHGVRVATRGPDPVALSFDRVDLDVAIGALLDGQIQLTVDATGPDGHVEGSIDVLLDGIALDLALAEVSPRLLASSIALPGNRGRRVRMVLPGGSLADGRDPTSAGLAPGPLAASARAADRLPPASHAGAASPARPEGASSGVGATPPASLPPVAGTGAASDAGPPPIRFEPEPPPPPPVRPGEEPSPQLDIEY